MLVSQMSSEKMGAAMTPENSGEKGFVRWIKSPSSSSQKDMTSNVTTLSSPSDYMCPTSESTLLAKLHGTSENMYGRTPYDWPYPSGFKTAETSPSWWEVPSAANGVSWFADMASTPAMPYSTVYSTQPEVNYSQLSAGLSASSSVSALQASNYVSAASAASETFKSPLTPTSVSLANYTPTDKSTVSIPSTAPASRGRRYTGKSVCVCPNCKEIDKYGISMAHLKAKGPHNCHIPGCGKVYNKTSHLKAHLRWHTGERPFLCNTLFCGKRYARSDELQHHMQTHGNKAIVCSCCNKRFTKNEQLFKHMKCHEDGGAKNSSPSPPATKISCLARDNNNIDPKFIPKQEIISPHAYGGKSASETN